MSRDGGKAKDTSAPGNDLTGIIQLDWQGALRLAHDDRTHGSSDSRLPSISGYTGKDRAIAEPFGNRLDSFACMVCITSRANTHQTIVGLLSSLFHLS